MTSHASSELLNESFTPMLISRNWNQKHQLKYAEHKHCIELVSLAQGVVLENNLTQMQGLFFDKYSLLDNLVSLSLLSLSLPPSHSPSPYR